MLEVVTFNVTENTYLSCGVVVPTSFLALLPDIPPNVEHPITVGTGEEGVVINVDGDVYACFDDAIWLTEGECVEVEIIEPPTCPEIVPPTPTTTVHEYEYNAKRVDPCEQPKDIP